MKHDLHLLTPLSLEGTIPLKITNDRSNDLKNARRVNIARSVLCNGSFTFQKSSNNKR